MKTLALQNGFGSASQFVVNGIHFACPEEWEHRIRTDAYAFSHLITLGPDRRPVVNWTLYAEAVGVRDQLTYLLLAAGILTKHPEGGNIWIVTNGPINIFVGPAVEGHELYFHRTRRDDAEEFIRRFAEIFAGDTKLTSNDITTAETKTYIRLFVHKKPVAV